MGTSARHEMAASVDATALLTAMGETMQYEYDVLTRQNQELHVNNLDIEEQARSDVIKLAGRNEELQFQVADASKNLDYVTEKRNWAERRLEEETQQCQLMRVKVAQVIERAAADRRELEGKMKSLNDHVKKQNVEISDMKRLHKDRQAELSQSLAASAGVVRQRDSTIETLQSAIADLEKAQRAAAAVHASTVASLKEAITGHVVDKDHFEKLLATKRSELAAEKQGHEQTQAELSAAKLEAADTKDWANNEIAHLKLTHETKVKLMEERYRQAFEASQREHQEIHTVTTEEHDGHCAVYEDQIKKCEAITQARIDELAALRKKSELEAQEAAHSLSCVRTELSDYKSQAETLSREIEAERTAAKEMESEYKTMVKSTTDAIAQGAAMSKQLRLELDRISGKMEAALERADMLDAEIDYERNVANEAVTAKELIEADLSAKLEAAIATVESLEQTVQELTSALDTKTKSLVEKTAECAELEGRCEAITKEGRRQLMAAREKQRQEMTRMTAELTAENRSKLAELTAENRSKLTAQKQEVTLVLTTNFKGEKASLCAEHASTLADMQADHDLKTHQLSRSMAMVKKELTTTIGELALSEQMLSESEADRKQSEAESMATCEVLKQEIYSLEADRDAADAREQQLRFELSDKQVSMARAAVQSQQQLSDKLVAENKMADAVKQAQRLCLERDSIQDLCEETHQKKEEYKQRLLSATENEQKLYSELEFAVEDAHHLRTEGRELEKTCEKLRQIPGQIEKNLGSKIHLLGSQLTEKERECESKAAKLLQEQSARRAVRNELGTALRDVHYMRKERDEVISRIPILSEQVASVKLGQARLLDEHVPLSTTYAMHNKNIPMVLGAQSALSANVGAYSLREFAGVVSADTRVLKQVM